MDTVRDVRVLRAMAKAGFIELHAHTGKKVGSPFGEVKATYVQGHGPELKREFQPFTFKGATYQLRYFDGSFFPYVTTGG